MSRTMKTFRDIAASLMIFCILGIVAYYMGGAMIKSSITGKSGITYNLWLAHFVPMMIKVTAGTATVWLVWYLLARFSMQIDTPPTVGKRPVWIGIFALEVAVALGLPYALVTMDSVLDRAFSFSLPIMFTILFGLVGFWGSSLYFTPAPYKYTPFLSKKIRAPKGGN